MYNYFNTERRKNQYGLHFLQNNCRGDTFKKGEILVSLMRQYTPMGNLPAPLDRRVTDEEYDSVLSWMYLNDLEGFTQESDSAQDSYIPDF